jgi:SAM-dependent methyltransferase
LERSSLYCGFVAMPYPAPGTGSDVLLCEPVTEENFEVSAYALANADVVEAARGEPALVRQHFNDFGRNEDRFQIRREALAAVEDLRQTKLRRLALALPLHRSEFLDVKVTMASSGDERLPVPFERISVHEYDDDTVRMVQSQPDGLFLDVGAGLRRVYRRNVVNAEIAALPSTDVLCFGDRLPFDEATFDGAICLSVLEHVPDPWHTAAEVLRVVKSGGTVVVDWPFLQPVHGYPHHYFNATEQGARETFERLGAKVRSSVAPHLHPIFTLHWLLQEWDAGLTGAERETFRRMTVADILAEPPVTHLTAPWSQELPPLRQAVIAAGTRLVVTKA